MYRFFIRSCKTLGAFIIHPCLPYFWNLANSRVFSLHGHYSASSLLLTPPTPSRLPPLSRCLRLYGFLAPPISGTGRGGSLQLLGVSLPSCCCFNPARVNRRISQSATFHAAFALRKRARPPGLRLSRPYLHSLSLRPDDLLTILKDGFVDRLQRFDFSPLHYPSYKVSDSSLGGTVSH